MTKDRLNNKNFIAAQTRAMRQIVTGWWPEGWKNQLQVLGETNNFYEEGKPSLQASSRAHS